MITAADEPTGELWTSAECGAYHGVTDRSWRSMVSRGYAPKHVTAKGRTLLWDADQVRAMPRPGQGARTDLTESVMQPTTPAEPLSRAVYGRELRLGDRVFRAVHIDGDTGIDLYVRREPRFESDRDDSRDEWVRVDRYTTLDITFDDAARRRFDAWAEQELRPELDKPGKHLRTYR
ncbi:hypothetical protein [Actinomadura litoris]|uniref:hypothetical protein n=1 Tax=Actinomadura litoris TaxID=2678616 RepID=UPI001FA74C9A|nr:hypothetical protein [Actinomadura litoris]